MNNKIIEALVNFQPQPSSEKLPSLESILQHYYCSQGLSTAQAKECVNSYIEALADHLTPLEGIEKIFSQGSVSKEETVSETGKASLERAQKIIRSALHITKVALPPSINGSDAYQAWERDAQGLVAELESAKG